MTVHDDCAALHRTLHDDGMLRALAERGPALERVLAWLSSFADAHRPPDAPTLQYPDYPLFPGLRNRPWHDTAAWPAAAQLEAAVDEIRAEWRALPDAEHLRYTPPSMTNLWQVYLLHYMGVDMSPVSPRCPRTHALLRSLPDICVDYAWADALFSVHASRSHLRAHCSVDNLRVRCHLALQLPPGCRIRVGDETRAWTEGRALMFEDSFEHEVWNEGAMKRAILIVDFWHPDLTLVEREAITALFAHAPVRRRFMFKRLGAAQSVPDAFAQHLREQVDAQQQLRARRCAPSPIVPGQSSSARN